MKQMLMAATAVMMCVSMSGANAAAPREYTMGEVRAAFPEITFAFLHRAESFTNQAISYTEQTGEGYLPHRSQPDIPRGVAFANCYDSNGKRICEIHTGISFGISAAPQWTHMHETGHAVTDFSGERTLKSAGVEVRKKPVLR